MKCPRCSAEMPQYQDADGGTYEACTCRTAKAPTLQDLVAMVVDAADKGEEVPPWKEAAKWAACLYHGGDAALAFVRWLDFEHGIVLANVGPGVCGECALVGPPDGEDAKHNHPPVVIALDGPGNGPEILLAMMHGVDLETVEQERAGLVAWWRARGS